MNVPLDEDTEMLRGDLDGAPDQQKSYSYYALTAKTKKPLSYTDFSIYQQYDTHGDSVASQQIGQLSSVLEKVFKVLIIVLLALMMMSNMLLLVDQKTYSQMLFYLFCLFLNGVAICAICGLKIVFDSVNIMFYFLVDDFGILALTAVELLMYDVAFLTTLQTVSGVATIICWFCWATLLVFLIIIKAGGCNWRARAAKQ